MKYREKVSNLYLKAWGGVFCRMMMMMMMMMMMINVCLYLHILGLYRPQDPIRNVSFAFLLLCALHVSKFMPLSADCFQSSPFTSTCVHVCVTSSILLWTLRS
jgi:hypothetical protein